MSNGRKLFVLITLAVLLIAGIPLSSSLAVGAMAQLMPAYRQIDIGTITTVTLNVQNVDDLYGYQVAIVFDPAVLEVVDADGSKPGIQVALGGFLQPDFVQQNGADNSVGAILCVISQLAPSGAVTGSGDLFTITFRGKAQGLSNIHFTDLKLARINGTQIVATQQDAQIAVGNVAPPLTSTPTATSVPPTSTPTATSTAPTPTPTSTTPTPTPTATTTPPTATPTPTSTSPAPGQTVLYVVHTGDTLYSIARRFGVSVQALMQVNAIANPNYIQVGQRLIIPGGASATPVPGLDPTVYIVQKGDNLYRIALRYGTTVNAIALANQIANPSRIFVGQRLVIPGSSSPSPPPVQIHVVQRGETLYSIARRYGTTIWAIAMANNIYNPNIIYAGQQLIIR